MWVESEEGKGSTFYVAIFARGSMQESSDHNLSPERAIRRPVSPLTGKRALLVGSRGTFHRMVGSMLTAWGMDISVAATRDELCKLANAPAQCLENGKLRRLGSGKKSPLRNRNGVHPLKTDGIESCFDIVIVDSFASGSRPGTSIGTGAGADRETSIDLVRLGCALAQRVTTVLLTSKSTRNMCDLDPNILVSHRAA
jgi:hypothetical protein